MGEVACYRSCTTLTFATNAF